MNSRVFMVEPTRVDSSAACDYGEAVYIFDADTRRCSAFRTASFGVAVLKRLQEMKYEPLVDSVCLSGSLLAVGTALVVIAQVYSKFNVLLFNSVDGKYVLRTFNANDWKGYMNDNSREIVHAT